MRLPFIFLNIQEYDIFEVTSFPLPFHALFFFFQYVKSKIQFKLFHSHTHLPFSVHCSLFIRNVSIFCMSVCCLLISGHSNRVYSQQQNEAAKVFYEQIMSKKKKQQLVLVLVLVIVFAVHVNIFVDIFLLFFVSFLFQVIFSSFIRYWAVWESADDRNDKIFDYEWYQSSKIWIRRPKIQLHEYKIQRKTPVWPSSKVVIFVSLNTSIQSDN